MSKKIARRGGAAPAAWRDCSSRLRRQPGIGCVGAGRAHDLRRSAAGLARSLPRPRDLDLPDLELVGRHATWRCRRSRPLRRAVVDAGRSRVGRGVVGSRRRRRRSGGAAPRSAARLGLDAALDHDRDRDRAVRRSTSGPDAARWSPPTSTSPRSSTCSIAGAASTARALDDRAARRGRLGRRARSSARRDRRRRPRWSRSRTSSSRAPGSTTPHALARRCRETGAFLVLDVFQSAGVLPLALRDWGVDAAVGGCLKWLCGGPGQLSFSTSIPIAPRRSSPPSPAGSRTRHRSPSSRRRSGGARAPEGSRTARRRCPRSTPRAPVSTSWPRSASSACARSRCG